MKSAPLSNLSRNLFGKFFCALLVLGGARAGAVPPPPGSVVPVGEVCRVNPAAQSKRVSALKAAPFFPVPLAPTTANILVVRVDFSDQPMSKTKAETESVMEKLKSFYLENSYGLLTASATVTNRTTGVSIGNNGAYRMPQTLAFYAQGVCSNYDQLAKDALDLAEGDYEVDRSSHIMIYHAGIGAETANDSKCQTDNIWSVFAPTVPVSASQSDGIRNGTGDLFTYDGRAFNGATFVPESELQNIDPLGVICHEYGHQLGLPDLYNGENGASKVGVWSLMDGGIYTGSPRGSNPAYLDAWSKQYLGFFSNPQVVNVSDSPQTFPMGFAAVSSNAYAKIPISGIVGVNPNTEYFLIERRGKSASTGKIFDDAIPYGFSGEGYAIWHVDDSILTDETRLAKNNVNSGTPNFGLDLVEAAGEGKIGTAKSAEGDLFSGSSEITLFAAPHSNSFGGQQTGIAVSGFYGSVLTAKKAFAANTQGIAKVINFPNPGGPAYPQKQGAASGTLTTIVLNTSKPAQDFRLTIHDLSGTLVRDVPEYLIRANAAAMGTEKFVYEHDWDGKTDSGETAAPGVYLYRFRIDDSQSKTGKLILVR